MTDRVLLGGVYKVPLQSFICSPLLLIDLVKPSSSNNNENNNEDKDENNKDKDESNNEDNRDNVPGTENNSNVPGTENNSNVPGTENNSNVNPYMMQDSSSSSPDYDSDEESGYATDSNRAYFEEATDAMAEHPVEEIPDDQLDRYIADVTDIVNNPEEAGLEGNDPLSTSTRQAWADRLDELRDEASLRVSLPMGYRPSGYYESESGYNIPESGNNIPETGDNNTESGNNISETGDSVKYITETGDNADRNDSNIASSSTNKRKFEADDESSTQPTKDFNQASSSTNKRKFEADDESSSQPIKEGFKQNSRDILPDTEPVEYGWESGE
jgi:hypothetical protein